MPKRCRYLLCGIGIIMFGYLLLIAGLSIKGLHRPLIFWEKTRLTWGEERIDSIREELMRRSPELRQNFSRFEACMRKSSCQTKPILEERNQIMLRIWPDVLSRLSIENDWGEGKQFTVPVHQEFLKYKRLYGERMLRECLPRLEYTKNKDGSITYQLRYKHPFTCPPPP